MAKHLRSITLLILFLALSVVLFQLDRHGALAVPPSQGSPLPPPPANDNFNRAKVISELTYAENFNTVGATLQDREPRPTCVGDAPLGQTVWYKFTPATSGIYLFSMSSTSPFLGLYTGSTLTGLRPQSCFTGYQSGNGFELIAGTTYYIQLGSLYKDNSYFYFALQTAPGPSIFLYNNYYEVSSLQTANFYAYANDPFQRNIVTWLWDFGDGVTETTSNNTIHRFTKDGDYTVRVTATTTDGRTGSATMVVYVRTHDVTITKFARPKSAKVGQTRKLIVSVSNARYPEFVNLRLMKSSPNGFVDLGYWRQFVDAKPNGQTTDFLMSYTFAPEDAQAGRVIFKAVAGIENHNDAFSADNEFTTFAIKVTGGNGTNADDAVSGAAVDDLSDYVTDVESNVDAVLISADEDVSEANFKSYLPLVNK